jgi:hypothetical protein
MGAETGRNGHFHIKAYRGDFKTLLAWTFDREAERQGLAGFTIACQPAGREPYHLFNFLTFERPQDHAQDANEPPRSSINAPFHKFRWLHVPGLDHQGLSPVRGDYAYTVTPRYFDANRRLLPLDARLSAALTIPVMPFSKGTLQVAFTRGYTQSQAFVGHFGLKAKFQPARRKLIFDTAATSGKNDDGEAFSYRQMYDWSGFTAREAIFALLDAVRGDSALKLDVFAYDLREPDIIAALRQIAEEGRLRLMLDNAALHHGAKRPLEDQAESYIAENAPGAVKRGKFGRYAHDKVFIVRDGVGARTVLTGSTNFAVTGLYVNSNHVLVYEDREMAGHYAGMFDAVWQTGARKAAFDRTDWATQEFSSANAATPRSVVRFSPHTEDDARTVLDAMAKRILAESTRPGANKSVLFAVMSTSDGKSDVLSALETIHAREDVFSFGISDNPGGIALYKVDAKTGVLVTGRPTKTKMPPPFSSVPSVGVGHQVHHKFVVCGFNGPDPVVYCGSSNLALEGEQVNGDNLLAIYDADVAAVFAIEALALVDHFNFLNRVQDEAAANALPTPPVEASRTDAAASAAWHLGNTDAWARKYFDPTSLYQSDRLLFAAVEE